MKHLISIFSSKGQLSSKRIITFLAFFSMIIAFMSDLFWDQTISEPLSTSMEYIVIAGLGFTASEKFAKNVN
jgi:hypothetical protein